MDAGKLAQGWDRLRAGSFAYTSTAFPMLTGTLVTAAGYLPIGLAQSSTGEYTQDIFRVVGLSLVLSWFVAVLFVPLLGASLLPEVRAHAGHDVYGTRAYRGVRRVVSWCVRRRWVVIFATVLAFAAAVVGFTRVPQQFFPNSDRLEVIIDMRLPEGSAYAATAAEVNRLDAVLAADPGVKSWVDYVGSGAPRFFLASAPELENANFAQVVVNMRSIPAREAMLARLHAMSDSGAFPDVRMRSGRLELGPPVGYPVQFRVLGPDPFTLRGIAAVKPGATTGDIGAAIQDYAEGERCSIVREFCGHGLGRLFHDEPNILHYGRRREGVELKPGMFFTIEPMVNLGRPHVKILSDGWTAVTRDRSLSAQFEHTVGVTEDGVEVFTFSPRGLHQPPYGAAPAAGQ